MKLSLIPLGIPFGIVFVAGLLAQQKPGLIVSTGVPPRAVADYQAHAQAGSVTIAADFVGHSVPTPEATFNTDQFVAVEAAFFGKDGERLVLAPEQFSLRVNGKKSALPSQPYALMFGSLKDPEWEEAQAVAKVEKAKTSIGSSGGGGGADDPKPLPPKMPIEVSRAMQQKVQKASMPQGDRPLPQAGLLFFQYGGKLQGIRSLELLYDGPAGKAKVELQP
jgi:hypothetical protein